MKIEQLRARVTIGSFSVTDHAILEGFKDGITVADMVRAIQRGRIIERYPERQRCLVYGRSRSGIPIHVVVDYGSELSVDLVTTYIPQRDQWIRSQIRKRKKR